MKSHELFSINFKPTFHTIEDIYEVQLDTDRGIKEKIRIFDTAGVVSYRTCSSNIGLAVIYMMINVADTFNNDFTFCVVKLNMLFTSHLYQQSVAHCAFSFIY